MPKPRPLAARERSGGREHRAPPWLFGALVATDRRLDVFSGDALGSALMAITAIAPWLGVDAERKRLEEVSPPLAGSAD